MKYLSEIKFKVNESPIKGHGGITCYQGQVIHNRTYNVDETRRRFADSIGLGSIQLANLYLDSLTYYIAEEIARGNRLDFGPFSVGLKMRGSLSAANAPFDPERNELTVEITPCKVIKDAVRMLKPVNVTAGRTMIYSALQVEPKIKQGKTIQYEVIYADGHRDIHCNGQEVRVHPGAADEGVWIENDDGRRLATGSVYSSDAGKCDFTLDEHIDPGVHWLVVSSRYLDNPELLRSRRRITVIANP